jgi:hypothetical protein
MDHTNFFHAVKFLHNSFFKSWSKSYETGWHNNIFSIPKINNALEATNNIIQKSKIFVL